MEKKRRVLRLSFGAGLLAMSALSAPVVWAAPQGGIVVGGAADISTSGKTTTINQHSQRAIIDWRGFDIGADEAARFNQPSSNAVALNRVNSADPTHIAGALSANGNIILINPNGVFFDGGSHVDVNGLIATTSNIGNQAFMDGDLRFAAPRNPDAAVVNNGTITAKEAGLVGLVAPRVANHGIINARLGRVELASGDRFTVDMYGDGLLELSVSEGIGTQLVNNTGTIRADGGTIALTAAAGKEVVDSLINVQGELHAPTVEQKDGKIIISAAGSNAVAGNVAADKGVKSGESTVLVQAYLDAAGHEAGEQGGSIRITGDRIAVLEGSVFDASGFSAPIPAAKPDIATATLTADKTVRSEEDFLAHEARAGGNIQIGGDYLGTGDTPAARSVYVASGAFIFNDAIESGDAGRTIVWSDGDTDFRGSVFSRGGLAWGNGGFLETSGKQTLQASGFADLSAPQGSKGLYLLDPSDITIYGHVDPQFRSTDGSIDLAPHLYAWYDSSDRDAVTLSYVDEGWGATATGTSGSHTIITSADLSVFLSAGERIRLRAAGADAAASTMGADTYTITSVSGTAITVAEALTDDYAADALYRGRVSKLADKSANGNDAVQLVGSEMPYWIAGGANMTGDDSNGLDTIAGYHDSYLFAPNGLPENQSSLFAAFNIRDSVANGGILTTGDMPSEPNPYLLLQDNAGTLRYLNETTGQYVTVGAIGTDTNYLFSQVTNGTARALYLSAEEKYNDPDAFVMSSPDDNSGLYLLSGFNSPMAGWLHEVISYDTDLDATSRQLVEQYQAARWGIALNPGAGSDEAAKAMGNYSVFAADYLERLSQNADLLLQADNSITLDLQGDALDVADGRNITLTATNGNITTASAGVINTRRTGADDGNITFNAGNSIVLGHDLQLQAADGGVIIMNAANGAVAQSAGKMAAEQVNLDAATSLAATVDSNGLDIGSRASSATLSGLVGGFANAQGARLITGGVGSGGAYTFNGIRFPLPASTEKPVTLPNTVVFNVQRPDGVNLQPRAMSNNTAQNASGDSGDTQENPDAPRTPDAQSQSATSPLGSLLSFTPGLARLLGYKP